MLVSKLKDTRLRLKFLFGSVEEGAKAFDGLMAKFASQSSI